MIKVLTNSALVRCCSPEEEYEWLVERVGDAAEVAVAEVAEPAEVPFVVERFVFENAEPGK